MSDPIIRPEHVREAKLCARGMRAWFERHGMNYSDFLVNGIPCSHIEPLNDPFGNTVVEIARKRAEGAQR